MSSVSVTPHASEKNVVPQPFTILEFSNIYDTDLTLIQFMLKEELGPIVGAIDNM